MNNDINNNEVTNNETPTVDTPFSETPAVETPVVEQAPEVAPVAETTQVSNDPVPMEPVEAPAEPVQAAPQVIESSVVPEKKKSKAPLICVLIVLLVGIAGVGYYLATKDQASNNEEPKQEEKKEEKKESKEKEETKKEEKEKVEEKKEEEKEETTKQEEKKETTTQTQQTEKQPEQQVTTQPEPTTTATDEVEQISGQILYLYNESYIGVDDILAFEHISGSSSPIVVEITVKDSKKKYTINLGEEIKVDGLKNKLVFEKVDDDDDFYFKIIFK